MIAEGGTELGHSEVIARSTHISGPYEGFPANPILTNRNTTEYFQTIGHADLFQDASGSWWGVALATRSGPEWLNYPMGRETVLFPATWEEGDWPVLEPVRGRMSGWPLPPSQRRDDAGDAGTFADDPDVVDFAPGETIPKNFLYWRFPQDGAYTVSPDESPRSLRLTPSTANLTGDAKFVPDQGITFIGRKQTDTLFTYSVDVDVGSGTIEKEVGVTVFLTQDQHLDLGVVLLASNETNGTAPHLRFRATGTGNNEGPAPATSVTPVPGGWLGQPLRLQIQAVNDTFYSFSAGPSDESHPGQVIAYAPATIVSGGTGPFTGES